jgi:putative flippase GtrA
LKYLIIGVLSNVISFSIFKLFIYLGFVIDISAAIGMILGTLNTYTLGRKFIKDYSINHSNKMAAVFIIYYAFAIYITSSSIELLGSTKYINHNFAWLICNITASLCNFIFLNNIALKLRN